MKKLLCMLLIVCMVCSAALADGVPRLSSDLFKSAKKAVGYLASGEYERLVTLLPFSDVAPSASGKILPAIFPISAMFKRIMP